MIEKMLERTSCRSFIDKKIEKNKIDTLKKVINSVPTSVNAQSFSAIFITDQKIKDDISKINWNQKHVSQAPLIIVFVADLNRTEISLKKENFDANCLDKLEFYTISVVDATIASAIAGSACLELGLSFCYLGGIRSEIDQACKILDIKNKAFPILALAIGYENKKNPIRPKINKIYDNTYNYEIISKELESYNEIMKKYYKDNFDLETNFTKTTAKTVTKFIFKDQEEQIKSRVKFK